MTSLTNAVPLSAQRIALERYLRDHSFSFGSVAGQIIAERLPVRYASDPLRPCLLLWACEAAGGRIREALPVAAAFDRFDRFLRLHDELAEEGAATTVRWGLGQSLNAGDALYALAFRALAEDVAHPAIRLKVAKMVGTAVLEAIELPSDDPNRRASLSAAALAAGALIGGATERAVAAFARAGHEVALAGQAPDERIAASHAENALTAVRRHTSAAELDRFAEAVRYVARRNL